MSAACEKCVFWDQSREYEFTGFCHRYAPSRPTPSARTVAGVHLTELWPVTGRGAWCGEFRQREPQPAYGEMHPHP